MIVNEQGKTTIVAMIALFFAALFFLLATQDDVQTRAAQANTQQLHEFKGVTGEFSLSQQN